MSVASGGTDPSAKRPCSRAPVVICIGTRTQKIDLVYLLKTTPAKYVQDFQIFKTWSLTQMSSRAVVRTLERQQTLLRSMATSTIEGPGWSQSAANTHKYALSSQLCQSAASEWPRGAKGMPRCSKRWSKGAQKHVPGHPGGGLFGTLGSKRAPSQNIGI